MSREINLRNVKSLSERNLIKGDSEKLRQVAEKFSVSLTPLTVKLAAEHPEVYRQYVPSTEELIVSDAELSDPIGDKKHSPVKGIVHRYPDRVLLKPIHHCAVYCRFCFRREQVGRDGEALNENDLQEALNYIEENEQIWEVILSGGDPLMLNQAKLEIILQKIENIDHVKVIRIHTRVPLVLPNRLTSSLLKTLENVQKGLYLVLHCNSSHEITDEVIAGIKELTKTGAALLSQSVLLRGVNDSAEQLESLFRKLTELRVKPYYLHHADFAEGTSHFRTSIAEGQQMMKELRGRVSGICQPLYVLDIPGGHGKIPLVPVYFNSSKNEVEDWQGEKHSYKENFKKS